MGFIIGYLLGANYSPDAFAGALFCLACGSATLLFLLFVMTVIIGNRLGWSWAQGFYPNIFLPDWRKKNS